MLQLVRLIKQGLRLTQDGLAHIVCVTLSPPLPHSSSQPSVSLGSRPVCCENTPTLEQHGGGGGGGGTDAAILALLAAYRRKNVGVSWWFPWQPEYKHEALCVPLFIEALCKSTQVTFLTSDNLCDLLTNLGVFIGHRWTFLMCVLAESLFCRDTLL